MKDNLITLLSKMAEGNPGAITVLMLLFRDEPRIDPMCAFIGLGAILHLDSMELYGSNIWILYKDICGESIEKVIGVLRLVQCGKFSEEKLKDFVVSGIDIPQEEKEEMFRDAHENLERLRAEYTRVWNGKN
ncbi:MAG: hypothetical protein WC511_02195 [Candidatus Pacearchaeota archaeon]